MPSFDLAGLQLRDAHGEGFFSEEERNRRHRVLERISAYGGKTDQLYKANGLESLREGASVWRLSSGIDRSTKNSGSRIREIETHWPEVDEKDVLYQTEALDGGDSSSNEQAITQQPEAQMPPIDDNFTENYYEISNQVEPVTERDLRDKIATKAFYTSTTQKLYQGVDWRNSKCRRPDPPSTVIEPRPDMVTQRTKRYESKPEVWQKFSKKPFTWDYLQTRDGHYLRRPFALGHVSGEGEKDVDGETFTPLTMMRSSKPKYTITSRRGYVPGYTGCVLWANPKPPLSAEREPRRESTARVHRPLNTPRNDSAYKHRGPLSRMVTLTHPFNPYNKMQPVNGRTASGNRV
eukprot:gene14424-5480_t